VESALNDLLHNATLVMFFRDIARTDIAKRDISPHMGVNGGLPQ
jgi:hypothetical protein